MNLYWNVSNNDAMAVVGKTLLDISYLIIENLTEILDTSLPKIFDMVEVLSAILNLS